MLEAVVVIKSVTVRRELMRGRHGVQWGTVHLDQDWSLHISRMRRPIAGEPFPHPMLDFIPLSHGAQKPPQFRLWVIGGAGVDRDDHMERNEVAQPMKRRLHLQVKRCGKRNRLSSNLWCRTPGRRFEFRKLLAQDASDRI